MTIIFCKKDVFPMMTTLDNVMGNLSENCTCYSRYNW